MTISRRRSSAGRGATPVCIPSSSALCGHFCLEPIACAARDPESKGIVEDGVRYVKHSALAGRGEELVTWEDYRRLAPQWRDEVANVRLHATTGERPIDRFQKERDRLRPLPPMPFDTDEVLPVVVTPLARVRYDGNRYSVPPAAGTQAGHAAGQRHRGVDRRSGPGSRATPALLRKGPDCSSIPRTAWPP